MDYRTLPWWTYLGVFLGLLFGLAAILVFFTDTVSAQVCQDQGVCQGTAYVRVCNQTTGCGEEAGGSREWCLTTAASCAIQTGTWEMEAGSSIILTYRTNTLGTVPPPEADVLLLRVLFDDTATVIATLHNAAPPADGTTFTFHATNTGAAGGTARAGTYRLLVDVDNNAAVGSYDGNSDGTDPNEEDWARGALRARLVVSGLTASTAPGTHFAIGPAGAESMTATATHTVPNGDAGVERLQFRTRINPDQGVADTFGNQDADTGTTAASSTISQATYQESLTTYALELLFPGINDKSLLTGAQWTVFSASSTGFVNENLLRRTAAFQADTSLAFSSDGATKDNQANTVHGLYNRGETVSYNFWVLNSRDQQLTRSLTVRVESSLNELEDSQTKSGANYSGSYLIASGDRATNDQVGDPKHFTIQSGSEIDHDSLNAHAVSSLYLVDAHVQLGSTLIKDTFPNDDLEEDFEYIIGAEVLHLWCHVANIRNDAEIDTNGNAVDRVIEEEDGDDLTSDDTDTESDGWTSGELSQSAVAPAGTYRAVCTVSFNGNAAEDVELVGFISSFTEDKYCRITFREAFFEGEAVRTFCHVFKNEQPETPDLVPTISIGWTSQDGAFQDVVDVANMASLATDLEEVSGTAYYRDWVVPEGAVSINTVVHVRIDGALTRTKDTNFLVASVDILTSGLEVADTSSLNVLVLAGITFLGITIWSRVQDTILQILGGVLVVFASIIAMVQIPSWEGMIAVATLLGITGGYMLVRKGVDLFTEAA